MNKICYGFGLVLSLLIITSACTKSKNTTTKIKPFEHEQLVYLEGDDDFDRKCTILKDQNDPLDDKKWKYDCSVAGDECTTNDGALSSSEVAELATLESYVLTGNANGYFSTPNWEIIFPQIVNEPALLNEIIIGSILLYELPNNSGSDYSVTYVLSTATTQAEIDNTNIIAAWLF